MVGSILRTAGVVSLIRSRVSPELSNRARLLTGGDRHRAEDLLQEPLVKLWFVWSKVAEQAPEAYVRKVLARAAARSARRRRWGERPVDQLPDPPEVADETAAGE